MRDRVPGLATVCSILALLVACNSAPEPDPYRWELTPRVPPGLRRLEASRSVTPAEWEVFVRFEDPTVRLAAYRAAARIGRAFPPGLVTRYASDEEDPRVLVEAAFASSMVKDDPAEAFLLELIEHSDARVREAAVRGLSRLETKPRYDVFLKCIEDPNPGVRAEVGAALAATAGRRRTDVELSNEDRDRIFETLFEARKKEFLPFVRWRYVLALAELQRIEERPELARSFAFMKDDGDPLTRVLVARGSARFLPSPEAYETLITLSKHGDWMVAVEALLPLRGRVRPSELVSMRAELERLTKDPKTVPHRRAALVEVIGVDPESRELLQGLLEDGSRTVRVKAFEALHAMDPEGMEATRLAWLSDEDPILRETAVLALARVTAKEQVLAGVTAALEDRSPLVRAAALRVLWNERARLDDVAKVDAVFRGALASEDLGDAGSMVTLLQEAAQRGELGKEQIQGYEGELMAARATFDRDEGLELRPMIDDLLGRGETEAGGDLAFTEVDLSLLENVPGYRAKILTDHGELLIQLDGVEAPRHVASFVQQARAGRFDGLMFHRVVAPFVVQGLDPRGDGWGSGGVRLPNEIKPGRFGRGAVGMPDAGLDTGGCQVFITHLPVPRLDARYTLFGQVVGGWEVLDRIERGDICRKVEIVEAPRPEPPPWKIE